MAIADFPFSFASQPIIDPTTGQPVLNATGGVLQDPATGNALPMADMNGNAISSITGNAYGMSQQFRSTQLAVLVKFGTVFVQAPAIEVFAAIQTANNAVSLATAAQQSAQDSLSQLIAYIASHPGGGGTGGVTDHGALSGLLDDDHPQYHTDARGDARYYTQAQVDVKTGAAASANSAADRDRANHSGTQLASTISDLTAAVRAVLGVSTIKTYTAAQGKPTTGQLAAAGVPDNALIVVDSA